MYQQIATTLYVVPVELVLKEYAYHLTLAMVPLGSTPGDLSGFWFILQDNSFSGHPHNVGSCQHFSSLGINLYSWAVLGFSKALKSLCKASLSTTTELLRQDVWFQLAGCQ